LQNQIGLAVVVQVGRRFDDPLTQVSTEKVKCTAERGLCTTRDRGLQCACWSAENRGRRQLSQRGSVSELSTHIIAPGADSAVCFQARTEMPREATDTEEIPVSPTMETGVELEVNESIPICLLELSPHLETVPSCPTATVKANPAATDLIPVSVPLRTGKFC